MNTKVNARPLNMDEKKKMEKIIHSDIDRAKAEYGLKHNELVNEIKNKAVKSPQVIKLVKEYNELQKQIKKIEKEANKMGLSVHYSSSSYRDDNDDEDEDENEVKNGRIGRTSIEVSSYGKSKVKEVKDAELKCELVERKLDEMKRTYTLKLFAGGLTEAENVFGELATELAKLLEF